MILQKGKGIKKKKNLTLLHRWTAGLLTYVPPCFKEDFKLLTIMFTIQQAEMPFR